VTQPAVKGRGAVAWRTNDRDSRRRLSQIAALSMRRQPVRTSLTRLEDALGGSLVEKLQEAVQHEGTLDSVATQHLVQGLTWVGSLRDIDAAPPVYQGLERAFKLVARQRGIVDQKNIFLIRDPAPAQGDEDRGPVPLPRSRPLATSGS
jgi:hypothetical protein